LKPKGENELAGGNFAKVENRNGCSTGKGSGQLLRKREKGFESAPVLNDEGVVGGVIFGQGGGGFALDEKRAESQSEERE
jgi:hypothetical protein